MFKHRRNSLEIFFGIVSLIYAAALILAWLDVSPGLPVVEEVFSQALNSIEDFSRRHFNTRNTLSQMKI